MYDRQPFLDKIIAEPDNDGPRLVYADWLEEQGEADQAEFIRVQVEMASFPKCPREHFSNEFSGGMCCNCQTRFHPLRDRSQELISRVSDFWPHNFITKSGIVMLWSRGFISSIEIDWADWLAHAGEILLVQPVEAVRLRGVINLNFSPIQIRNQQDDENRRMISEYSWTISGDRVNDRFVIRKMFYFHELRDSLAGVRYQHQTVLREAEEVRTIRGYIKSKWPRIKKWHLPHNREDLSNVRAGDEVFLEAGETIAAGEYLTARSDGRVIRGNPPFRPGIFAIALESAALGNDVRVLIDDPYFLHGHRDERVQSPT